MKKWISFSGHKAFGLLITLLLTTLLSGFASVTYKHASQQIFITANHALHLQALTLAKAGVNLARAGLLLDKNDKDDLEEEWNLLASASQISPIPLGKGYVSIEIIDEDRKQNINSIKEEDMPLFFKNLGLKQVCKDRFGMKITNDQIYEDLAASYLDWVDPDNEERGGGAEKSWYDRKEKKSKILNDCGDNKPEIKYFPHNNKLATLGELLWIKGFSSDMLFGKNNNPRLLDQLTIYGGGKININTASVKVLETLFRQIDEYMAKTIAELVIEKRPYSSEDQAWQVISGFGAPQSLKDQIKVKSEYFRIIATGILGKNESIVEAVVKRSGETCDILMWQERQKIQTDMDQNSEAGEES